MVPMTSYGDCPEGIRHEGSRDMAVETEAVELDMPGYRRIISRAASTTGLPTV